MSLAPNQQISEYHIVRVLGQGAFGTVYLAHDTLLDRPVAIKELTVIAQTDEVAFKRFLQEARAAGGLNHPNIVTVHALKVVESNIYLVMEYLAGSSLRALLKERGPLPVEEAMRITADMCDGLAAAHAKGIIHRDVKPENILLTENGRAKVGDFGIAHVPRDAGGTSLTQFGFQPGTLIYMSPEQIRGQPVDGRSDVYQVGTLLYEMLTGRHYVDLGALEWRARETAGSNVMLFQARLYEMLAEAICERDPEDACRVRPDVPEWIGEALAAALAKALEERPTSEELARALRGKKAVWAVSTMPPHLVGIAPAEEGLSRDMAYAQQGLLDVGRAFISTQHLDVLGRPRSNPEVGWQELGATPARIHIPPVYEFGIRARSLNDDGLAVLTKRLTDFGPIQLLDLSHSYITNAGLVHLRGLTELHSLNLWDCRGITDVGLQHLKVLQGLANLDLSGCDITDWGLRYLKALPNLTDLSLTGCDKITDTGLTHLQALPKLANLHLSGMRITDRGMAELKSLKNLASLELVGTTITDTGVVQLAALTSLRDVWLGGCGRITGAGFAHWGTLTGLASLSLYQCDQIADAGLANLRTLNALTSLIISQCSQITDAGLVHLKAIAALIRLDLGDCKQITDEGLAHVGTLTGLTELDLHGCDRITDAGLAHLRSLVSLRSLDLSFCKQITDAGLGHLKALTSLTELKLVGCNQITDIGLAHLRALTHLSSLDLTYCGRITDMGLAYLQALTAITKLRLMQCYQITDDGLEHLKTLANLTSLDLTDCEGITDAGMARLERPGLNIRR